MEIKVYVDVLFFVNLFMNYILLWLLSLFIKVRLKIGLSILSSCVGAIYAVGMFFIPVHAFYSVAGKIAMGGLMVWIAFLPKSLRQFIKYVCIFYTVTFVCGGMGFALLYYTGAGTFFGTIFSGGTIYMNIPIYKLIFVCTICYLLLSLAFTVARKIRRRHQLIYDVKICYREAEVNIRALYDSANFLKETSSGKSVMIVRWDSIRSLFDTTSDFNEYFSNHADSFVPIPYKSVGGHSMIFGFMPEYIYSGGAERKMYVGISEIRIGDEYDAILPNDFEERNDEIASDTN